jgi:hypothetical protein
VIQIRAAARNNVVVCNRRARSTLASGAELKMANRALHRNRPWCSSCKRVPSWAGSLSLVVRRNTKSK